MKDPIQMNNPYHELETEEEVFVKVLRGYSIHSEISHRVKPVVTRCYDDFDKGHEAGGFRIVRNL